MLTYDQNAATSATATSAAIDYDLPGPPPRALIGGGSSGGGGGGGSSVHPPSSGPAWDETAMTAYNAFFTRKKKQFSILRKPQPQQQPATKDQVDDDDDDDDDDDEQSSRFPAILLVDNRLRSMRSVYLRYLRQGQSQSKAAGGQNVSMVSMGSSGGGNLNGEMRENTLNALMSVTGTQS